MGTRLFVGNLSWNVDDRGLEDAFAKYGEVTDTRVITDRDSGRSRGFGFVTFAEESDATDAKGEMDGTEIDGRPIRVDWAQDKQRDNRGGGGGGGRDRRGGHNRRDGNQGNRW